MPQLTHTVTIYMLKKTEIIIQLNYRSVNKIAAREKSFEMTTKLRHARRAVLTSKLSAWYNLVSYAEDMSK